MTSGSTVFLRLIVGLFLLCAIAGCAPRHYASTTGKSVTLYYNEPGAVTVQFASSLDRFQLHPAAAGKNEVWEITLPADRSFSYFYVVDGRITVPECSFTVPDEFGARNCYYPHGL